MGDLSKNFSSKEFDCPCGCAVTEISSELVLALQKLRDGSNAPIFITSGYRCATYNKKIGGSSKSLHIKGEAADIVVPSLILKTLYTYVQYVESFNNGGIGVYPESNFLHVDVRGVKARWSKVDGVYVSIDKGLARIG